MARQYAAWELCEQNMSGIHTWSMQSRAEKIPKGVNREFIACNRCKTPPPTQHRARLYNEIKAALNIDREQRRMSAQWRKATGR